MERSSEALYVALWHRIFELAPGLRNSVTTVISDFERQMIASIRQELPHVNINGCWFFYRQVNIYNFKDVGAIQSRQT